MWCQAPFAGHIELHRGRRRARGLGGAAPVAGHMGVPAQTACGTEGMAVCVYVC